MGHRGSKSNGHYFSVSYFVGIVLMRGDVDTTVFSTQKAQFIANMWQLYHLDDKKYSLVQKFNHQPDQFNYKDLLDDLDKLAPDTANKQSEK